MTPRVRVALLADTHGYVDPRVLGEALACDHVVHAGDVGGAAVLEALSRSGGGLTVVRGNNDLPGRWGDAGQGRLETLPLEARLELPGGALVVVHGHRSGPPGARHERLRRDHAGSRAVVYGHSHRLVVDLEGTPWVLNPGAAGRARTHGGPSYIRLIATRAHWEVEPRRFPPLPPRARVPGAVGRGGGRAGPLAAMRRGEGS